MKKYKKLVHVWLLKEGARQAGVSQEQVVLACGIPFRKYPEPESEDRDFADNPSQVARKQKEGWYKKEGFNVCKDCLKRLDVALLYEVDL